MSSGFYIGFDLSTQQLKALVIDSNLKVHHEVKVDFDADFGKKYGIKKGVHVNEKDHSVYAPVAMWLDALDLVLSRLKDDGAPLDQVCGVSGSGQQHGSVFWSKNGEDILESLDPKKGLVEQLGERGFTNPSSPNWQDASTQRECDAFDQALGSEVELAEVTGSKAHHRFTGPQIMKLRRQHPEIYDATTRISLVSSFLASVLAGKIASIDISDVCGMNLWEVKKGDYNDTLLELVAGKDGKKELSRKLGPVDEDAGALVGPISAYYVSKYGFSKDCQICQFTGDNPATILSLPLRPLDAMVSLGTSTTMLMATKRYLPDPAYHFFNSPTTAGIYMFMLCYKNGGLAREKTRDELPKSTTKDPWAKFNEVVLNSPPAGRKNESDPAKLGLYFPLPEIVPNVRSGTWRHDVKDGELVEAKDWKLPEEDARTIVESQILSLRLRSHKLVHSPKEGLPPQPRRVYVVGGGAQNPAIARVIGDVLGGSEGVYKLDVGGNACALGGAYKAVWSLERENGETFEELIGGRWRESEAIEKIDDGYKEKVFASYGELVPKFEEMEKKVLAGEKRDDK